MKKMAIIVVTILLFASFNLLALATIYLTIEDDIVKFRYSDSNEFNDISGGLKIINELPIQFNISNEYFSGFDNLSDNVKESIGMAYLMKNRKSTYRCGNGNDICIDKDKLKDVSLLKIFHSKIKFVSNSISFYLDDYGNKTIHSTNGSPNYRLVLNGDNKKYRKYSKFSKYREDKDIIYVYVYEGYYIGNCDKDSKLELYDFIDGDVVYSSTCNDKHSFVDEPKESDYSKLQLYKYEFKKDKDGELYLFGYNPVNK